MSGQHVLITGGAGFIGSHLADLLIARGHRVTILDCLLPQVHADAPRDADGWPVYLNPAARRIRGDLLTDGVFEAALQGATRLVHLAASVGVGQSMTNIVDYCRNNVMSAAMMLETLSRTSHSIERIAVASSMSIYGEGEYRDAAGRRLAPPARTRARLEARLWDPADADGGPLEPVPTREEKRLQPASIYAVNKNDHEQMFLAVGQALSIPTVALRLFNVYGSRQALSNPYTGVAAIFIARLLNDHPPLVFEDGMQRRDFVHVSDVARAFAAAIEDEAPVWDCFNVGSGRSFTVLEIAETLARLLGKPVAPEILGRCRVGDVRHCFADTGRLAARFGLSAARDFEAGMAELIEWVRRAAPPVDRGRACLSELEGKRLVV